MLLKDLLKEYLYELQIRNYSKRMIEMSSLYFDSWKRLNIFEISLNLNIKIVIFTKKNICYHKIRLITFL